MARPQKIFNSQLMSIKFLKVQSIFAHPNFALKISFSNGEPSSEKKKLALKKGTLSFIKLDTAKYDSLL